LAKALNNLGIVYWRQGRERAAIKPLERALAIQIKNEGPRSGAVVGTLQNLSQVHQILDELDIAERCGQEALAVEEALYPPNHPSIGGTLDVLGHVAQKRGDRARARALYERSIRNYEGSQRPNNPSLAWPLSHLAGLSLEEGEEEEAVRLDERALALRRKALGDRHPEVAESWHDLAVARGRLDPHDLNAALEALGTGLDTFRSTLPADSFLLARGLFLLGDVLRLNGRPSEALPYLEEACAIWGKKPPSSRRDLADLEAALAATRAAPR
jgi:tetratricopeptide (TPR) repeat protein